MSYKENTRYKVPDKFCPNCDHPIWENNYCTDCCESFSDDEIRMRTLKIRRPVNLDDKLEDDFDMPDMHVDDFDLDGDYEDEELKERQFLITRKCSDTVCEGCESLDCRDAPFAFYCPYGKLNADFKRLPQCIADEVEAKRAVKKHKIESILDSLDSTWLHEFGTEQVILALRRLVK